MSKQDLEKAIENKDETRIKQLLNDGVIPDNVQTDVVIETKNFIEILLSGNNLAQDGVSYNTADRLFKLGAPLPKPQWVSLALKNNS